MRALRQGLTPLLAATLVLTACGPAGPESQATHSGSTPAPTPAASPGSSLPSTPTLAPAGSPTRPPASPLPQPTARPSAAPTAVVTPAPGGSATPGSLASCTGTDANRQFYADVAARVSWDVYCPALPKGWFVETGRLSSGALTIAYKTTGGLRLELKEGGYCTGSAATCGPTDSVIGTAMFGDREGQLGRLSGNLVLYVNPGANPAWQAVGIGLDEATFRSYTAAFVKVPG